MNPAKFPEANITFTAPPDLDKSQVREIRGFRGLVRGGSMDGAPVFVVAYHPSPEELEKIKAGKPIFFSLIGWIPPHFPSMSFEEAIHPA